MSLSTTRFDLNNGHHQVLPLKNTFRKILFHRHQVENEITSHFYMNNTQIKMLGF